MAHAVRNGPTTQRRCGRRRQTVDPKQRWAYRLAVGRVQRNTAAGEPQKTRKKKRCLSVGLAMAAAPRETHEKSRKGGPACG